MEKKPWQKFPTLTSAVAASTEGATIIVLPDHIELTPIGGWLFKKSVTIKNAHIDEDVLRGRLPEMDVH